MGTEKGALSRIGVELADAVTVMEGPPISSVAVFLGCFHVLAAFEVLRACPD
jgi:hypothetical protein